MVSAYVNQKILDLHKLIRPIQFVPENMKINDCLKLLQSSHTHIAIVISEYGTTSGLVTMEDILEELVGDIHDEGDEESVIVKVLSDTTYLIDATASIGDINDNLSIPLPESAEYDTLAGYINTLFGRIPSIHESIATDDYLITITKRKKQRVDQVKLTIKTIEE
jgi:CBS domain containing-hemolysin-like protein